MKNSELYSFNRNTETFTFNAFEYNVEKSVCNALVSCNKKEKTPIILCIGSDLVLGDSLGPLIGTMLTDKKICTYIYGTLKSPITAKEIACAKIHIKMLHPDALIVAVDAAVGSQDDIGLIKVTTKGLKPGLGVDKNLGVIGDCSVIGIVAEKSVKNYNLFNLTRLSLIYKMAEKIANGVERFVSEHINKNQISV